MDVSNSFKKHFSYSLCKFAKTITIIEHGNKTTICPNDLKTKEIKQKEKLLEDEIKDFFI